MPAATTKPAAARQATGPEPTTTYAAAYATLAAIAEKLKAAGAAASVDTLVEDVRAARAAHAVCRTRLAAVRTEVEAELALADETDAAAPTTPA